MGGLGKGKGIAISRSEYRALWREWLIVHGKTEETGGTRLFSWS